MKNEPLTVELRSGNLKCTTSIELVKVANQGNLRDIISPLNFINRCPKRGGKFIPLASGQMAYLALLFDVFTRTIRGWELSRNMSVNLLSGALRKALARQHRPQIHHSDRGGQYIAEKYCQQLRAIACRISMTDRGKPWQNPYVESTIGRIKDEYIVDSEYQNFHDAYNQLSPVLDVVYNQKRPHSALGYRTPAEFEAAYNAH